MHGLDLVLSCIISLTLANEMISLGDTAISLHILQPSKPKVPRSEQISMGRGGVLESQNPKCQDLSKFQLWEGGGGGRLCSEPNSRIGVFCAIWSKISGSLACLCITDSLSHTTYVETNQHLNQSTTVFYFREQLATLIHWLCNFILDGVNFVETETMLSIEFFLNDFTWIWRIQWTMTKSKSDMVAKGITHLVTNTLPVLVISSAFSLLLLGTIYCQLLLWTDANLQIVVENSFLPLHKGMYLLSDLECFW